MRPALFWMAFVFMCFSGGYLFGWLPERWFIRQAGLSPSTRIIAFSPKVFNTDIVQLLSSATEGDVVVESVVDVDRLALRLSDSPAPDLLIVTSDWISELRSRGLIREFSKDLLEILHPDFRPRTADHLPFAWLSFFYFLRTAETTPKILKTWLFYDPQSILSRAQEIRDTLQTQKKIKAELDLQSWDWTQDPDPQADLLEWPHNKNWPKGSYYKLPVTRLWTIDLAIPFVSEDQNKSELAIRALTGPKIRHIWRKHLKMAISWREESSQGIPAIETASQLRNLQLPDIKRR
ncbi:MAG: hypothetical protein N2578_03550 [Bdellovibrionaceae bacterium]|nr:hypothetical protein [Pseudobdellovibrionaceae bacterium]